MAWGLLAVLVSAAALGVAVGVFGLLQRRVAREAQEDALRQAAGLRAQRDAAERRAKEAVAECDRLKSLSLASRRFGGESVFTGRPSPRDAEELARIARGLTFVDDVVIADASGLALSRETGAESADLAPLAPAAFELVESLARAGFSAAEVSLETFTAVRIAARPLDGRGAGSVALVRTTSQPVNPLVLDAVAFAAAVDVAPAASAPARPSLVTVASSGVTDRHDLGSGLPASALAPLERALGADHRAYVVVANGRPVLSAASLGPNEAARSAVAHALAGFALRAARGLRVVSLARVEVTLADGGTLAWSSFGMRARHALVTFTDAGLASSAKLDRLVGSVRRAVEVAQPASLEGAA